MFFPCSQVECCLPAPKSSVISQSPSQVFFLTSQVKCSFSLPKSSVLSQFPSQVFHPSSQVFFPSSQVKCSFLVPKSHITSHFPSPFPISIFPLQPRVYTHALHFPEKSCFPQQDVAAHHNFSPSVSVPRENCLSLHSHNAPRRPQPTHMVRRQSSQQVGTAVYTVVAYVPHRHDALANIQLCVCIIPVQFAHLT